MATMHLARSGLMHAKASQIMLSVLSCCGLSRVLRLSVSSRSSRELRRVSGTAQRGVATICLSL
eukprot:373863-Pyramimonas_sp.AAC.1